MVVELRAPRVTSWLGRTFAVDATDLLMLYHAVGNAVVVHALSGDKAVVVLGGWREQGLQIARH